MIAAWMLYIALWSLWLSAAAIVIERVMLAARLPVRGVWTAAVVLSMASPFVGATIPRHRAVLPVVPTSSATASPMHIVRGTVEAVPREATVRARAARIVLAADRPLAAIWIGLSALMICYVAGGVLHLRRVRREWRSGFLNGTPVLVSPDTGPAVVGVFHSAIVVPEWALALEPRAVALLLEHEKAHRAAGDVRLLALAQLAVVAMPWNLALWWQLERLRLAVELDCDARVIRSTADVRSYGQLLLDCGEPPRTMSFGGAALIGHRTQLERRIEVMTKRASRGRASSSAASVAVGFVAVFAACQMPAPASPPASVTPPSTLAVPVVAVRDTASRQTPSTPQPDFVRGAVRPRAAAFDSAFAAMQRLSAVGNQLVRDHFPTDSEAAVELEPACSVGRGGASEALVKLLVSDAQANVGGRIELVSVQASESGSISVAVPTARSANPSEYNKARADLVAARMTWKDEHPTVKALRSKIATLARDRDGAIRCAGYGGEFRVFGRHAFDSPIVVKSAIPTRILVVTGSGRTLVGPIAIANEDKSYALTWDPRAP